VLKRIRSEITRAGRRFARGTSLNGKGAFLPAGLTLGSQADTTPETRTRFRPGTSLADMEREAIQQCLIQTAGNRQQTAELLGISTRTLLRKIQTYRLEDPLRPGAAVSDENSASP
jgi:two-component system, NtrC family, response regulator AtoC